MMLKDMSSVILEQKQDRIDLLNPCLLVDGPFMQISRAVHHVTVSNRITVLFDLTKYIHKKRLNSHTS